MEQGIGRKQQAEGNRRKWNDDRSVIISLMVLYMKMFACCNFVFYTCDWNFTDTHNFTLLQRRESFALCIIALAAAHTCRGGAHLILAEGVHREEIWQSAKPKLTFAALLTMLLISPNSEGWKAELTLPPTLFAPGKKWIMNPAT